MDQLLPVPASDVDLYEAYRPATASLVRINMVASADGAVVAGDGRSGSIGGSGDRTLFRTLRAHADAIVVGAGTVRQEGYGPHRPSAELAQRRAADGRPAPAAIVVVSRSLDLDLGAPLFTDAVTPTIVLTVEAADPARRRAAEGSATVVTAGQEDVDPAAAVAALRDLGCRHVLVEGGPALNARLLSGGVVDELCLTLAPILLGGRGPRLGGQIDQRIELRLQSVIADDTELFLRYTIGGTAQ